MSTPVPGPGPSGGGTAAIDPADAREYAGRVGTFRAGVTEAYEALLRLSDEPLAVGSGQDNHAIAGWHRELLVSDAAPAARRLVDDLETLHRSVHEVAAAWERADGRAAGSLRPDVGPA